MLLSLKWKGYSLLRKLANPIGIFAVLQVVWLVFIILWIFWFTNQTAALEQLFSLVGEGAINSTSGFIALVIGSILMGMLLVGTVVLFIYTQVQGNLIRQQNTFVSSVTHELRSPLSSIQLSFETLQRPNLPDPVRLKLMDMVDRDIERLSQLIDRILVSARLDRGILDYASQLESFNLREAIYKCIDRTNHMDRKIKDRTTVICPDHMRVRGIKMAFNMILGNLIENAIKYSPKGSHITVNVIRNNQELCLSVKDQGFGLNGRDKKKIFQMFHRTPRATKNAVPGTGLGLYIVRSMVRGLGGRIWVESEGIGKGSTFYVAFPANVVLNHVEP